MNIDDALRQACLEPRLVSSDIADTNPWFLIVERDLSLLCQNALPTPVNFTFNISRSIQACVLYRSNLVVMTAGMFNVLCRVASKIVTSGVFIEFEGGVEPTWTPNAEFAFSSVASDLSSTAFNWGVESKSWHKFGERQLIFFYILQTLTRFVVLHELGHVFHNHGARFQERGSSSVDVDLAQSELLTNEEGVASQAREIIADNFAFIRLKKIQERELASKAGAEATDLLVSKLLRGEQERVRFLLTTVYLYFHMMDRHDWYAVDIFRLTHPPAPFRLKNLFALTLETGVANLNEDEIGEMLMQHHYVCNALVSVVYNHYPTLDLFKEVSTPRFNRLFNALYEEYPKWQNLG
ncbi:hypothetical protein ACCD00_26185 [Pseudomonas sp. Pseusp3]|uniref:hypothetical protein n=1 Tax=Pseudomonas sp. Pseusp3 TaxID=3243029 RepID=UPI0039B02453